MGASWAAEESGPSKRVADGRPILAEYPHLPFVRSQTVLRDHPAFNGDALDYSVRSSDRVCTSCLSPQRRLCRRSAHHHHRPPRPPPRSPARRLCLCTLARPCTAVVVCNTIRPARHPLQAFDPVSVPAAAATKRKPRARPLPLCPRQRHQRPATAAPLRPTPTSLDVERAPPAALPRPRTLGLRPRAARRRRRGRYPESCCGTQFRQDAPDELAFAADDGR